MFIEARIGSVNGSIQVKSYDSNKQFSIRPFLRPRAKFVNFNIEY